MAQNDQSLSHVFHRQAGTKCPASTYVQCSGGAGVSTTLTPNRLASRLIDEDRPKFMSQPPSITRLKHILLILPPKPTAQPGTTDPPRCRRCATPCSGATTRSARSPKSAKNGVFSKSARYAAHDNPHQYFSGTHHSQDYKLRAADHRQKKAKLKILSEKARDRNPDEFSFKMMSSSVDKKGRKVTDRGNEALSLDVVKLLKTQDAAYIRTMLQQVRRERQKLEERLVLEEQGEVRALRDGEDGRQGKHRVFVENEEEQEEFDPDEWFGQGRAMPSASRPEVPAEWEDEDSEVEEEEEEGEEVRPQKKTLSARKLKEQEDKAKQLKKFEKTRSRAQSRTAFRLSMVKKKERELVAAEEELEKQRAKMNNSVGGVNKNGVKFKIRERKR